MILNVDGDRNAEETETNRVMLFTRIKTIIYDKSKHGYLDTCSICYTEYEDNDVLKSLPKCEHTFHSECIEKWVVKTKSRNVFCPVCRIDIKEELDSQDQMDEMERNELQEDTKENEGSINEINSDERIDDLEDSKQSVISSQTLDLEQVQQE